MVSYKGKLNANQSRVGEDHRIIKNVGMRDFKIYSDSEKIKVRGREFAGSDAMKIGRKPSVLTRKSLPVSEGSNQTDLSHLKGSAENLEKSKGKRGSSVKIKVGRKVLADVSNVRNNLPRSQARNGSKPVTDKNKKRSSLQGKNFGGKILYGPRISVGQSTDGVNATSRKPVMGKLRVNRSHSAENHHPLKNTGIRDYKVSSIKAKTKVDNHESFGGNSGTIARRPLMLTRKSLPVQKRASRIDSSDVKENDETLSRGIVTIKVGRKVIPDVSNAKSYLWRNRASDGFISKTAHSRVPVGQSAVHLCALSRKPIRTTGRTTLMASKSQMTSKSKCTLGLKKSTSANSSLSKKKEEVAEAPVPENTTVMVSHEPALEKLPYDGNSYSNMTTADISSRSRCSRRKSYTSLLMARSKVLGEHAEVIKQEELENVDDNTNHLEVAEYVDQIYQYYWVMEAQNPPLTNYMMIQTEITPKMRGVLINWLIEVHHKFDLMQETLFLMVALLDRFLSKVTIGKEEMQLVGLTALLLASKYEDFWHPKVRDLISISADSYTRDQMLGMEKLILKKLMFRLNAPTPYVFMLRFLKVAKSDAKLEHLAFYLIELSLVEYEALKFKPSLLCASAIYLARCTLQISPAWTKLLSKHAHYKESELRDCAEMILKFHKGAGRGLLKVTYEKFMSSDHSCVAAIKAMDKLPF